MTTNPIWNQGQPGGNGVIRPGASPMGQPPPAPLSPPFMGAENYGGYTDITKTTYARTRVAPVDFWQAPARLLQFLPLAVPDPGIVGRAAWNPPVFDCRPDLKHAMSAPTETAQPIWKDGAYGAGLCLYVFIDNIDHITEEMAVYSIQLGHPYDSTRARDTALQAPQDITADFLDGREGVILRWAIPGYRFWRLNLRFDQLSGVLNSVGTRLQVQAAIY